MAINKKARSDEDVLDEEEVEADDLADDQNDDTEAEEGTEDEAEEGKDDKDKAKRKETEVERLARELAQAKKAARTEARRRRDAEDKLTKLGIDEKDDPIDIKAERDALIRQRDQLIAQQREAQKSDAIREVLSAEDKYAPYQKSVKYIKVELDLSDDDLDPDTGLYDMDALGEQAERAVERYVKNAPKPAVRQVGGGSPGGEPRRGTSTNNKETEQELAARLEKQFGVRLPS